MQQQIALNKFQPTSISDNVTMIVAPRGCGKTMMLRDLLYRKRHFPIALLHDCSHYEENYMFVPFGVRTAKCTIDLARRICHEQAEKVERYEQSLRNGGVPEDPPTVCAVFDNFLGEGETLGALYTLLLESKRLHICVLISTFDTFLLPEFVHAHVDVWLLHFDPTLLNAPPSRDYSMNVVCAGALQNNGAAFDQLLQQVCTDFRFLVIEATRTPTTITDNVLWYRAENRPHFQMRANLVNTCSQ